MDNESNKGNADEPNKSAEASEKFLSDEKNGKYIVFFALLINLLFFSLRHNLFFILFH